MPKITIQTLREKKARKEPMTYLTGYDYPFAMLEQKAGIDVILVGDSIGMVVYGYDSTLPRDCGFDDASRKGCAPGRARRLPCGGHALHELSGVQVRGLSATAEGSWRRAGCDAVKLEGGRESGRNCPCNG